MTRIIHKFTPDHRRIHRCDVCTAEAPWDKDWRWWGSYLELENNEHVLKICSDECQNVIHGSEEEALQQKALIR